MQEEAIYRCVNPACARPMPRPVKFCPWCGTAQAGAQGLADANANANANANVDANVDADAHTAATADVAAVAAAAAAAQLSGWSDAPDAPDAVRPAADDARPSERGAPASADSDPAGAARANRADRPGLSGAGPAQRGNAGARANAPVRGIRLGTLFGHSERAPQADPPSASPQSVPRPPLSPAPTPPRRRPVRLRWWLAVLAVLACVWYVARPNAGGRIDARIAHAAALAKACKAKDAQEELIALRKTRATPAQLARLQDALNDGAAACTRQRQRDKAWNDASAAAESALADGNAERARARLQAYARHWGEDARTRALRDRIEEARHPLAAPDGSL